jgi:two-component system, NarL family, response regulator NreC
MASHLHLAPRPGEVLPAPAGPIRVLLAIDHAHLRGGLLRMLDEQLDVEVVAQASDLSSASDGVQRERPHVLVLDLGLPGGSCIDTIGQLRERIPDTEIVVLTMEHSPILAQRALTAGASGYVTKDQADSELPDALRAALRGEQFVSPPVAARLETLHRSLTENTLTAREVEVLRLIALGHTSVEIARKLHLSPRTVETHRAHIHRKLGLATRAQLVGYALRRGLLGTRA